MKNDEFQESDATSRIDARRDPQMMHKDDPTYAMQLAKGTISEAVKRPKQMDQLAEETKSSREILFEALKGVGDAVELFKPKSDEYIRELRMFKIAAVAELSIALKSFEDVRKFFLSDKHDAEIAKLREFVDLCERLNRLKQSGFLDAVSETILKLEL